MPRAPEKEEPNPALLLLRGYGCASTVVKANI